jgi:hypothetical protein
MADKSPRPDRAVEPDTVSGSPDDDRLRGDHASRRKDEPAAAAFEADAEAGAAVSAHGARRPGTEAPADPVPEADAARKREEEEPAEPVGSGEVRAGPGDAGAADRPTPLPLNEDSPQRAPGRKAVAMIVVLALVLLIVFALL